MQEQQRQEEEEDCAIAQGLDRPSAVVGGTAVEKEGILGETGVSRRILCCPREVSNFFFSCVLVPAADVTSVKFGFFFFVLVLLCLIAVP